MDRRSAASILGKLDLHPSTGDHRRVMAVLAYLEEASEPAPG